MLIGTMQQFLTLSLLQLLVPKCLPPDTPFNEALPLAIDAPINDKGKRNIYTDDSIFFAQILTII